MKKLLFLLPLLPLAVCAQFSQPVKDSVTKLLKYNSAQYNITLGFQVADYVTATDTLLDHLSKEELLAKLTGKASDAPVYGVLVINAYFRDKDMATANQYVNNAYTAYQQWINEEPANPVPVEKLTALLIMLKNYGAIPGLLDYALPLFPKNLNLLQQAVFFYTYAGVNLEKSQQYLNDAFNIDPANITTLVYQTSIHQQRALMDFNAGREMKFPPVNQLDEALRKNPRSTALLHVQRYYQLMGIYFSGIARAIKADTDDVVLFNYFQLTAQEQQYLKESEQWFQKKAKEKAANQQTLVHTLGVISCMLQQYEQARNYFEQAVQLKKDGAGLQALALAQYFLKQYPAMKETIQQKIALEQLPDDYSSLLWLYRSKLNDTVAEKQLLAHLASLNTNVPANIETLVTGYLLNGQKDLARDLLPGLTGDGATTLALKTIAAVLFDEGENARNTLQTLLEKYPSHEQAVKLKKFIPNL